MSVVMQGTRAGLDGGRIGLGRNGPMNSMSSKESKDVAGNTGTGIIAGRLVEDALQACLGDNTPKLVPILCL